MKRIVIAPRVATFALAALTFFAGSSLAIGALLVAGASSVAAHTDASPLAVRITGALLAVLAALVLWRALRQFTAIASIFVDPDGWGLVDRLGRIHALEAGTAVTLTLRCRRVVFTWGAAPRIQDVVDGTLATTRAFHLAPSGRHTYAQVLSALGLPATPPERGHTARFTAKT